MVMSGAAGETHPGVVDGPAEGGKSRDERRQEKIQATGFGMLGVPTGSPTRLSSGLFGSGGGTWKYV